MWRARFVTIGIFTVAAVLLHYYYCRILIASLVVCLATDEFQCATNKQSTRPGRFLHVAAALGILNAGFRSGLATMTGALVLTLLVLVCLSMFEVHARIHLASSNAPILLHECFVSTAVAGFGHLYVAFMFSHVALFGGHETNGCIAVTFVLVCTGVGETAGLLFGRMVASFSTSGLQQWLIRHPVQHISPNKSTAGFLAQLVCTPLCSLAFYRYTSIGLLFSASEVLVWGIMLAVGGISGDLFESLIKRAYNLKDMSDLLPGVGGMMDRFDGSLFNFPLTFYFLFFLAPDSLGKLSPLNNPALVT